MANKTSRPQKLLSEAQMRVKIDQQSKQIAELARALNDAISDIRMLAESHDALLALLVDRGVVPSPDELEASVP